MQSASDVLVIGSRKRKGSTEPPEDDIKDADNDLSEAALADKLPPKSLRFLEDENGVPINAWKLQAIRSTQRRKWFQMIEDGTAPRSWAVFKGKAHAKYVEDMHAAHSLLALCDDHWKVDKLATIDYPRFYRDHVAPTKTVKTQGTPAPSASTSGKRRAQDLSQTAPRPIKKARGNDTLPAAKKSQDGTRDGSLSPSPLPSSSPSPSPSDELNGQGKWVQ